MKELFLLTPIAVLFYTGVFDMFIVTILPQYFKENNDINKNNSSSFKDLTFLHISMLMGLKIIGRLPSNIIAGILCNSVGSDFVMLMGLTFYVISLFLYIYSDYFLALTLGRIIEGVSSGLTVTAAYCFACETSNTKFLRSFKLGLSNFSYFVGLSFGATFGGILYSKLTFSLAYICLIPLHIVVSLLIMITIIKWQTAKLNEKENSIENIEISSQKIFNCATLYKHMTNYYLLIALIGCGIGNGTLGFLSVNISLWIEKDIFSSSYLKQMVWVLGGLSYGAAQLISIMTDKYLQKASIVLPLIGMILIAADYFILPFCFQWIFNLINISVLFYGIGLIEYFFFPLIILIIRKNVLIKADLISSTLLSFTITSSYLLAAVFTGIISAYYGFLVTCFTSGILLTLYIPLSLIVIMYITKQKSLTDTIISKTVSTL